MDRQLKHTLYNDFDFLFQRRHLSATESCMYWGISCGNGWYNIIRNLCLKITEYCEENNLELPQFEQVKQKFGTLRIYLHNNCDANISQFIREAENESSVTCEISGEPGTRRTMGGWIYTLSEKQYTLRITEYEQGEI